MQRDDLINGQIRFNGTASQEGVLVNRTEISLDGGRTWIPCDGTNQWTYTFTPITDRPYDVLIRAQNTLGVYSEPSPLDQVQITYHEATNTSLLTGLVNDLCRSFSNGDVQGMQDSISDSYVGGKSVWQSELDRAVAAWSSIAIRVSNLSIDTAGNQAAVQVTWTRTWSEQGTPKSTSGSTQLVFVQEGAWKWSNTSGDRLFSLPPVTIEPGGAAPPRPPQF
ncbi:hypothetical protein CCP3SC1_2430001 [Gammaproteobacteria bacterium]